jgi:hypothetical protein
MSSITIGLEADLGARQAGNLLAFVSDPRLHGELDALARVRIGERIYPVDRHLADTASRRLEMVRESKAALADTGRMLTEAVEGGGAAMGDSLAAHVRDALSHLRKAVEAATAYEVVYGQAGSQFATR